MVEFGDGSPRAPCYRRSGPAPTATARWHRRPEKGTPRLAGQARVYLHKQLDDFASGARLSDWMAPVARALSDEQRDAVAAYYASLYAIPYPEAPYGDPHLIQEARVLSAIEPVRIPVELPYRARIRTSRNSGMRTARADLGSAAAKTLSAPRAGRPRRCPRR
jgi:hypothetical protein